MIRTPFASDWFSDVLDGIRGFIDKEVVPRHERHEDLFCEPCLTYDKDGRLVDEVLTLLREVRVASAKAGFYNMFVPEELGGGGLGLTELFLAYETVFHHAGPHHWLAHHMIAHWAKGPSPVFSECSEFVRQEVLPGLVNGETSMCFALSEPDAGSDVWMMRTRAEPRDGGWRLNGEKQWITNGPYADFALVFAVTEREAMARRRGGATAFIVPTSAPGFEISSIIRMFGAPGGDEAIIGLRDVWVSDEHVVGRVGAGFELAAAGINRGKLYNAAKAVGLASWALDRALEHVGTRETFGAPLTSRQGVMFPLAESVTELHAATLLALNAARLADDGQSARNETAMAKVFATEAGVRAVDRVMQIHGGMGFTNEMGLHEAWRALRKVMVADGSAEMMRRQIAREWAAGRIRM